MELMEGKVKVTGKKSNVLDMFENIEEYYDKNMISQYGSDDNYTIEFNFCIGMNMFLGRDYFAGYSEEYDCEINAEMVSEDDGFGTGPVLSLSYKSGEILQGMAFYGLDDI